MLNLFQHLIASNTYETLNQVQGDKKGFTTQPLKGEEGFCGIGYPSSKNVFTQETPMEHLSAWPHHESSLER
jgi:hypothetical protein